MIRSVHHRATQGTRTHLSSIAGVAKLGADMTDHEALMFIVHVPIDAENLSWRSRASGKVRAKNYLSTSIPSRII